MIKALAHICFVVRDLERSLAFYQEALGLELAFDFKRESGERHGVYLHAGRDTFIELFTGQIEERAARQSYQHFCLEVDDINESVASLRAKGVTVTDPKLEMDLSWQAWLADPEGNRIELHQYMPRSWQVVWRRR